MMRLLYVRLFAKKSALNQIFILTAVMQLLSLSSVSGIGVAYTKIIAFCLHSLQGTSSPFRFYSFGSYCPVNRNTDNIISLLIDVFYLNEITN